MLEKSWATVVRYEAVASRVDLHSEPASIEDADRSRSSWRWSCPFACCDRRLASWNDERPLIDAEPEHVACCGLVVQAQKATLGVARCAGCPATPGPGSVALHHVERAAVAEVAGLPGNLGDLRQRTELRGVDECVAAKAPAAS